MVLRDKGVHAARVLTAGGEVALSRRYFWAKGQGGRYPADRLLGVEERRISPGASEVLCRMGIVEDFAGAAEDAQRIGNVPIGRERLRQVVEAEGAQVTQVRQEGVLQASWTQADAKVEATGQTRVYAGIDGVMAPMVTRVEQDKKRKEHVKRRQARVRQGLKNAKELGPRNAGHDEKYREMKIGVFYDQDKIHRHCFATAKRWQGFACLLRQYAAQVDFAGAFEALTLTDGAQSFDPEALDGWIVSVICMALAYVQATLLDFFHLSEHVHQAAKACLGETPAALAWAKARLAEIKEHGTAPVLLALAELNKKVRSPGQEKAVATAARLPAQTPGDARLQGGAGQGLGHRLGPHRSHVQEPDPASETPRHEMGRTPRGSDHESDGDVRERPEDKLLVRRPQTKGRMMPKKMVTPGGCGRGGAGKCGESPRVGKTKRRRCGRTP